VFLVPDWDDIVDSGIGLSYRPARIHKAGGPVRQPYAKVDFIPQSRTGNFCLSSGRYQADEDPLLGEKLYCTNSAIESYKKNIKKETKFEEKGHINVISYLENTRELDSGQFLQLGIICKLNMISNPNPADFQLSM
jgi:hypothetical protein